MLRSPQRFLLAFIWLSLLGILIFNLPPVKDRLGWRVDELRAQVKYALAPPEQVVFVPQQGGGVHTPMPPLELSPTPTAMLAAQPSGPTHTPFPTLRPTLTPTQIPENVQLFGFRHEYQGWNNCGPATLAIALSYWGWQGDQYDIAPITKPNPRDKNVMPYEMASYVEAETQFNVALRVGGQVELLIRFLAAGLPVIIEKGFEGSGFDGWMGHYVLVTGYDGASLR